MLMFWLSTVVLSVDLDDQQEDHTEELGDQA